MNWISVKDKLPPYGKRVLVIVDDRWVAISARIKTDANGEHWDDKDTCGYKILYWMPLPEIAKNNN